MAAKIVFIALALIISVGLATWALAWAYGKAVETRGEVETEQIAADNRLVDMAEEETEDRRR